MNCYCENSHCSCDMRCTNSPEGNTHIEYMGNAMCDDCATQMPLQWHLSDCRCSLCVENRETKEIELLLRFDPVPSGDMRWVDSNKRAQLRLKAERCEDGSSYVFTQHNFNDYDTLVLKRNCDDDTDDWDTRD